MYVGTCGSAFYTNNVSAVLYLHMSVNGNKIQILAFYGFSRKKQDSGGGIGTSTFNV